MFFPGERGTARSRFIRIRPGEGISFARHLHGQLCCLGRQRGRPLAPPSGNGYANHLCRFGGKLPDFWQRREVSQAVQPQGAGAGRVSDGAARALRCGDVVVLGLFGKQTAGLYGRRRTAVGTRLGRIADEPLGVGGLRCRAFLGKPDEQHGALYLDIEGRRGGGRYARLVYPEVCRAVYQGGRWREYLCYHAGLLSDSPLRGWLSADQLRFGYLLRGRPAAGLAAMSPPLGIRAWRQRADIPECLG